MARRSQSKKLKAENAALKAAVFDLTSCGDEACKIVHHGKDDRHEVGERCPVLERYRQLAKAVSDE